MLNHPLLFLLTNLMIGIWLKNQVVNWYAVCLIIIIWLVIIQLFLITLWQLHNNVGKVCINSGYQILCLMIMVMRIYSSIHSIFSNQSSGLLLLFLANLQCIHMKLNHSVFVNLKKLSIIDWGWRLLQILL